MAFENAHDTVYELCEGVPTINENGKVTEWQLCVKFSCDNPQHTDCITKDFRENVDVSSLDKTPGEFTQAELLGLLNIDHYCMVFDSMYGSITTPPIEVFTRIDAFDVSSLS
jgi:hypothetical protein